MTQEKLCKLFTYSDYEKGESYFFEDENMARYARYLDSKRYAYQMKQVRDFTLPISPVYAMMLRKEEKAQLKVCTDLGVEVKVQEIEYENY